MTISDDVHEIERRWRPVWESLDLARAREADGPRMYVLDMFPYPSGDLHMGHAEAFAIGDVIARYWMRRGYNVLHPVGWDSFGLPAENAAIKRGEHPEAWTSANISTQAASFHQYAISFDWSTRLHTSDPEYYRWTQWLFLRLFERGLAYRKTSFVNWCPQDQTVLANEQVVAGSCERCGTPVTKRELMQWYFRITDYADRLLDDMELLRGHWPESVLSMQRNWIGRSRGAEIDFHVDGQAITVFTTRPDTIFGATFLVVAPDAPLADQLCAESRREALAEYRDEVRRFSDIDRLSVGRAKTGVDLGVTARHPLSGESMPVFASDYVLPDYGTGAIMAVPAHDQRDLEFAKAFSLPIRTVVETTNDPELSGVAAETVGPIINSGALDGATGAKAIDLACQLLAELGAGRSALSYRLRDWLVPRQRFWGAPIPIIHCDDCGEVAVPDEQLPVTLPDMRGDELQPKGQSPLASNEVWKAVLCPNCGSAAVRDTDTMDTFVDSSWYYLRYCSPKYEQAPFDPVEVSKWLPVSVYVGGVEHAILHLLYARFFAKFLKDLGMVEFDEPFSSLVNQGQVILNGAAMSKSTGNLVSLSDELERYGVDAVRLSMVFAGPPEDDIDWADVAPSGSVRFLARVVRLASDVAECATVDGRDVELDRAIARATAAVTSAIEDQRFNVAIARLMDCTTILRRAAENCGKVATQSLLDGTESLSTMLSCFAPYTAEEAWATLGHDVQGGDSVHRSFWPEVDAAHLVEERVTCVLQVDGKVRDRVNVPVNVTAEELRTLALSSDSVRLALGGRSIRDVVVRAPRVANVVSG